LDPKEIRELIELISRSNFAEFEMEREGFKLKLVKQQQTSAVSIVGGAVERPATTTIAASSAPALEPATESVPVGSAIDDGSVELNSPIVGTFYRAPGPDSPAFVEVGSRVKKGQVMCIVEAMKVMNEIESEIDAEVVDVPVTNGQPVEFGEVLFRLRPLN
jgi:acetyl-CoA carboxylase biotin carboxyl carrier protein